MKVNSRQAAFPDVILKHIFRALTKELQWVSNNSWRTYKTFPDPGFPCCHSSRDHPGSQPHSPCQWDALWEAAAELQADRSLHSLWLGCVLQEQWAAQRQWPVQQEEFLSLPPRVLGDQSVHMAKSKLKMRVQMLPRQTVVKGKGHCPIPKMWHKASMRCLGGDCRETVRETFSCWWRSLVTLPSMKLMPPPC